jgi:hypothetical protein
MIWNSRAVHSYNSVILFKYINKGHTYDYMRFMHNYYTHCHGKALMDSLTYGYNYWPKNYCLISMVNNRHEQQFSVTIVLDEYYFHMWRFVSLRVNLGTCRHSTGLQFNVILKYKGSCLWIPLTSYNMTEKVFHTVKRLVDHRGSSQGLTWRYSFLRTYYKF